MGIKTMAKGKNKQISKRGGARGKQERHPFSKKQWYKIQSPPNVHNSVQVGWTPVNKTVGTKLSKDNLLNRVCEVSYGDIQDPTNFAWKKIRMQVEEVKGSACYTSFYGINIIRERLLLSTLPEELQPALLEILPKMLLTRISHKNYWTRVRRSTHYLTFC